MLTIWYNCFQKNSMCLENSDIIIKKRKQEHEPYKEMSEESTLIPNMSYFIDMPMLDNLSVGNNDTKVQNNNNEKYVTFNPMEDCMKESSQSFSKPKTNLPPILKSRITENDTEKDVEKDTEEEGLKGKCYAKGVPQKKGMS